MAESKRFKVAYFGSTAAHLTNGALQDIQYPLLQLYRPHVVMETDFWLSECSEGLQLIGASGFFFAQVVRRFSKNSFRHSIAVRCDATADGGGFTFLPLDEPVMSQPSANHWSLFAFISQRTWADFECHAFACQREADAIHLVRLFTKMAANKNRGSENQPPENDCCNCDRCDCDG